MKKLVGQVSPEERDAIKALFERKNGLIELSKVLTADNDEIYDKLVMDMGATNTKFQKWWDTHAAKYNWEGTDDGHWEIDFETCDIYLVTK